jgi:hypothetical protein
MPISKKSDACELSHVLAPSMKSLSQPVIQVGKQVVVTWSKIRAVRTVATQLPVPMLQQSSSVSSCMEMLIVMDGFYTRYQHSMPFVMNGPVQFL